MNINSAFIFLLGLLSTPFVGADWRAQNNLSQLVFSSAQRIYSHDFFRRQMAHRQILPLEGALNLSTHRHPDSYLVRIEISLSPDNRGRQQELAVISPVDHLNPNGYFTAPVSGGRGGRSDHMKGHCFPILDMFEMVTAERSQAKLPFATFFLGKDRRRNVFGIHGPPKDVDAMYLGNPASAGCIRTDNQSAERIQLIIKRYGKQNSIICVH